MTAGTIHAEFCPTKTRRRKPSTHRSLLAERLNLFVVQLVETEQMIIIDFRYANRLVKVVDELLIDASISPVINEHANY